MFLSRWFSVALFRFVFEIHLLLVLVSCYLVLRLVDANRMNERNIFSVLAAEKNLDARSSDSNAPFLPKRTFHHLAFPALRRRLINSRSVRDRV